MDVVDRLEEMNVTICEDFVSITMLYSLSLEFGTFRVAINRNSKLNYRGISGTEKHSIPTTG